MPDDDTFPTKPALAFQQIEAALAADVPRGVILADAGYRVDMKFQAGLLALELDHVVGVQAHATVWPDGMASQNNDAPPKSWSGRGRPSHNLRHTPGQSRPWAQTLAPTAWQEGSNAALTSRFVATRVRPAQHVILR